MTVVLRTFVPDGMFLQSDKKGWGDRDGLQAVLLSPESLEKVSYSHVVAKWQGLDLGYAVLTTRLADEFKLLKKEDAEFFHRLNSIKQRLIELKELADWLFFIHKKCLGVSSRAHQYRADSQLYAFLLDYYDKPLSSGQKHKGPHQEATFPLEIGRKVKGQFLGTSSIRKLTGESNWYRLFIIRLKRLAETVVPVLDVLAKNNQLALQYSALVMGLKQVSGWFLPYVAWLFYLPRLMANSLLVMKHTVMNPWMSEQEKSLGWALRLQLQMKKRWFEFVNDSLWVACGLLTCFLFTGPIGSYLVFAAYGLDCLVMGLKCGLAWRRVHLQKSACLKQLATLNRPDEESALERKTLIQHMQQLDKEMVYQKKQMLLSLATVCLLFAVVSLTLPFITSPFIALAGAAMVVLVALGTWVVKKKLDKQNPTEKVSAKQAATSLLAAKTKDIPPPKGYGKAQSGLGLFNAPRSLSSGSLLPNPGAELARRHSCEFF